MIYIEFINENRTVASLSVITAQKCGVHPNVVQRLYAAAALHDIGKTHIPAKILHKPGKLTDAEFEVMKEHTKHGADILKNVQGDLGAMSVAVALYHHEKWDATGYWGKYSSDLPLYVPIVSIADVFVALCSGSRAYKEAWPPKKAMEYIKQQSGTQFSPALVDMFIDIVQNDGNLPELFANQTKQD